MKIRKEDKYQLPDKMEGGNSNETDRVPAPKDIQDTLKEFKKIGRKEHIEGLSKLTGIPYLKLQKIQVERENFLQKALEDIYQKGVLEGTKSAEDGFKRVHEDISYQKGKEDGVRGFVNILDEVLLKTHDNGVEKCEGKDLNGSMFHYFVFQKLKEQ